MLSHLKTEQPKKRDMAWPYVQKGIVCGAIYFIGEAISCGLFSCEGRFGLHLVAFIHAPERAAFYVDWNARKRTDAAPLF